MAATLEEDLKEMMNAGDATEQVIGQMNVEKDEETVQETEEEIDSENEEDIHLLKIQI